MSNIKEKFIQLLEFIRLKLCISAMFLCAIGYLLFANPSLNILWFSLSCFFVCAGAYSYNNIMDRREDFINKKRVNPFASRVEGKIITIFSFFASFIFTFFLTSLSILFYIALVILSLAYSTFRLKKYFLVKNLYTGFGATLVFLIGAAATSFTIGVVYYYIILSIFVFIGSVISDLRDYTGDRASGIKTLPVYLGYDKTKYLVTILLAVYSVSILMFTDLLIFLPFIILMFFAIKWNKPSVAHSFGGFSFIFLAFWLVL